MANEWLAEGFVQLGLGAAWNAYAVALAQDAASYRALAERLRRDVVEQFLRVEWVPGAREAAARCEESAFPSGPNLEPPSPPLMAWAWISQARALHAWQAVAAEIPELHRQAARQRRWAELREECERVRQELADAQQKQSRLQSLVGSGNLARSVNLAATTLDRCHKELAEFADANAGTKASYHDLEQKIAQLLGSAPADWMPRQLVELQQNFRVLDPERYGGLLGRMAPIRDVPAAWISWDRYLERELPESPARARASLLVLRAVLDALGEPTISDDVWDRFEATARPLFLLQELDIQLIRDPGRQRPEWFITIPDPSREESQLGRIGLAVRPTGRDAWTCFARGERYTAVSQPQTPEQCALAELDALVKAAEALSLTVLPPPGVATDVPLETGVNYANLGTAQVQELEQQWAQWQEKWHSEGLEAQPSQWTFRRALAASELKLADDEMSLVFRSGIPRGVVFRVKAFGLRRGEETIRPCAVYVSAGPGPAGFGELYRLVEQPANAGEEGLKQRLRGWPAACLQDALSVAAVRLYLDYWGDVGEVMRQKRPAAAQEFGEHLARLLRQELGLETFHPESYQDYPDGWLLLGSEQGAVTGQVRRVLRPGLRDSEGNLHVPAVVDVE